MELLRSILPAFIVDEPSLKPEIRALSWSRLQVPNSLDIERSDQPPTQVVPVKADESAQPPEQPYVPFEPKRSKPIDIVNPRSLEDRHVVPPLNFYWQPGKPIVMPHQQIDDGYSGRRRQ
jgi:hypothetical protein